jgi:hypothetical protein
MIERVYLPSGGALAGIPGEHAPGLYDVDYESRTITPVDAQAAKPEQSASTSVDVAQQPETAAQLENEISKLQAEVNQLSSTPQA